MARQRINPNRVAFVLLIAVIGAAIADIGESGLPWWIGFLSGAVVASIPNPIYRGSIKLDWLLNGK